MVRTVLLAVGAALIALPSTVHAQGKACAERAEIMKRLGARYLEQPVAAGVANNGGLLEVLSSKDGSTWSIIVTMPDGRSCMFAVGQNWEMLEKRSQEEPAT